MVHFIALIMISLAFPFAFSVGIVKGSFIWKSFASVALQFIFECEVGVGLVILITLSIMNHWNPIYLFITLPAVGILMNELCQIAERPEIKKLKIMEG
ncbi:hypothetical protein SMD22_00230 (plasmid) [Brevibacillus halotolerans]|nr:hypothetical protein SMD22_00230 [Brevibacillus halotolerans]